MRELASSVTHENIKELMDSFYDRIYENSHLGPIFKERLGESAERWSAHKEHIGNFWRQMLLGEQVFIGQPMKAHIDLPRFPQEYFAEWLSLFETSLLEIYTEPIARVILSKAQMVANNLQRVIYDVEH